MNLNLAVLIKLEGLKIEAMKAAAYSNYWAHYATSPGNLEREVTRGGYLYGEKLDEKELIKDAFATSLNHIRRLDDIQTAIYDLEKESV